VKALVWLACLLVPAATVASLCFGRLVVPPLELLHGLTSTAPVDAVARSLVLHVRLPRVLAALCVGAALSVSGATYQTVFRNPLVSPGLLGVLAGAGFGAALAIVLNLPSGAVEAAATIFGIAAAALATTVAQGFGQESLLMLVFGGMISTALFTALLSSLQYVADPEQQLPDIVFWLLGSLSAVSLSAVPRLAVVLLIGTGVLVACGRMLDALAMGDDEARSLGVPVGVVRFVVLLAATLMSVVTVSAVGMIGWVGLVVPHLARLMVGSRAVPLLGASAVLGGLFMLVCDDVARGATAQELPVGIVTDLVGVVAFLVLLRLRKGAWS